MKILVKKISSIQCFKDLVSEAAKEGVTYFAGVYGDTGKVFIADAIGNPKQVDKASTIAS